MEEFSPPPRPLLEFHGNLANGRGPSLRTFLARVLRRAYGRVFFSLFFLYRRRAIFWEVGVPLSGFRSIVFRPACASLRPLARECADVALARERVQAQDRIIPTCSCHARTHARTYTDTPVPAVVRSVFYTSYGRGIFALEHTRQLVSLNTAAAMIKLESRIHSRRISVFDAENERTINFIFLHQFLHIKNYRVRFEYINGPLRYTLEERNPNYHR